MIIIGSDHAGVELKETIIKYFVKRHIEFQEIDCQCDQTADDYPDVAEKLCHKVLENNKEESISESQRSFSGSIAQIM